ncbi:MAG: metal-dependent transcriptional regulator [Firmicutes bacterium]|nr:metal-dependent transcriptional regulator [Bacillota bacterium]
MKIQESAEDYLETILKLSLIKPSVRSIDIATEMNFSKPSVSIAMKHLREKGQIVVDENGSIRLTAEGKAIACRIYERHLLLSELLRRLGVPEEQAVEEACHIEHDMSQDTFDKIREWAKSKGIEVTIHQAKA